MNMQKAFGAPVGINSKQARDPWRTIRHFRKRFCRKCSGSNGARIGCHNGASSLLQQARHMTPQVTIGDNSCEPPGLIGNANNAKSV